MKIIVDAYKCGLVMKNWVMMSLYPLFIQLLTIINHKFKSLFMTHFMLASAKIILFLC